MLNAVIGPERLRQFVQLSLTIGFRPMLAGEAAMLRGMPVSADQHRNLPGLALSQERWRCRWCCRLPLQPACRRRKSHFASRPVICPVCHYLPCRRILIIRRQFTTRFVIALRIAWSVQTGLTNNAVCYVASTVISAPPITTPACASALPVARTRPY